MASEDQASVIAVIGAGGPTGLQCVKRLLEATNHQVRAVVREPDKYKDILPKDDRVTIVEGDVCKAHTLREAFSGCEGAIFAASASSYYSPESVDFKGVAAAAKAAEELKLKRFVLVSSKLVTPKNAWHPFRMLLNNVKNKLMDNKFLGEEAVRATPVSYTIVRPGGLTNSPLSNKAIRVAQGDSGGAGGSITRADVAAICVEALSNPGADRVTFEVVSGDVLPEGKTINDALKEMWNELKPDEPAQ